MFKSDYDNDNFRKHKTKIIAQLVFKFTMVLTFGQYELFVFTVGFKRIKNFNLKMLLQRTLSSCTTKGHKNVLLGHRKKLTKLLNHFQYSFHNLK